MDFSDTRHNGMASKASTTMRTTSKYFHLAATNQKGKQGMSKYLTNVQYGCLWWTVLCSSEASTLHWKAFPAEKRLIGPNKTKSLLSPRLSYFDVHSLKTLKKYSSLRMQCIFTHTHTQVHTFFYKLPKKDFGKSLIVLYTQRKHLLLKLAYSVLKHCF